MVVAGYRHHAFGDGPPVPPSTLLDRNGNSRGVMHASFTWRPEVRLAEAVVRRHVAATIALPHIETGRAAPAVRPEAWWSSPGNFHIALPRRSV